MAVSCLPWTPILLTTREFTSCVRPLDYLVLFPPRNAVGTQQCYAYVLPDCILGDGPHLPMWMPVFGRTHSDQPLWLLTTLSVLTLLSGSPGNAVHCSGEGQTSVTKFFESPWYRLCLCVSRPIRGVQGAAWLPSHEPGKIFCSSSYASCFRNRHLMMTTQGAFNNRIVSLVRRKRSNLALHLEMP